MVNRTLVAILSADLAVLADRHTAHEQAAIEAGKSGDVNGQIENEQMAEFFVQMGRVIVGMIDIALHME